MRAVLSALHSIRNHSVNLVSVTATTVGVSTARRNSVLSYVQSLFTRPTPLDSAQADSITTDDGGTLSPNDDNAHIISPRSDNNTRDSALFTDGVMSPAVCSACHTTSPEVHSMIFCVLCFSSIAVFLFVYIFFELEWT